MLHAGTERDRGSESGGDEEVRRGETTRPGRSTGGAPEGSTGDQSEAGTREYVRLLAVDADLAEAVPAEERALAGRKLVAPVQRFEPGDPGIPGCAPDNCLGLLMLDGFLTRDVVFAGQRSRELLGAGDLLRPGDREDDFLPPFAESSFTVLIPSALALLHPRLLTLGARWPRLVEELMHRIMRRSRWLAIRLAINNLNRVDERLLLFFWHAAGRWGRITQDGVALRLTLTHEMLAELIGAQRPSVTTALSTLKREGKLRFRSGSRGSSDFVLLGNPPNPTES